jgi:hypothetical protein
MIVATQEKLNESSSARFIREEPVVIADCRKNVECICGLVRYDMLEPCPCGLGTKSIKGYRVAQKDEILLDSKTAVKTRFWYHATTVENWASAVKDAKIPVHVGSLKTATDRAEDNSLMTGEKTYHLYTMVLNPFANISDTVCPDLCNDWSETLNSFNEITDADFVRYVNTYENSGSISLFGNPNKFIIVSKTTHTVTNRNRGFAY